MHRWLHTKIHKYTRMHAVKIQSYTPFSYSAHIHPSIANPTRVEALLIWTPEILRWLKYITMSEKFVVIILKIIYINKYIYIYAHKFPNACCVLIRSWEKNVGNKCIKDGISNRTKLLEYICTSLRYLFISTYTLSYTRLSGVGCLAASNISSRNRPLSHLFCPAANKKHKLNSALQGEWLLCKGYEMCCRFLLICLFIFKSDIKLTKP